MTPRGSRFVPLLAVAVAVTLGAAPVGAVPNAGVCALVTIDELDAALGSTFQPGSADQIGTGRTCSYEGVGPVRGATVRVARGKQAKLAMSRTLEALRETQRDIGSKPPKKVAGLGDRAYYSLDEFLDEGFVEVLDGRTFVQVTAILSPGGDPALISEPVLVGLARQALART